MKSTHKVEVIRIKMEPHDNADSLSVVKIGDYTCCIKTEQWQEGQLAAWIPPDNIVDVSRPEFEFLSSRAKDGRFRITVQRMRGIQSYGLLVPAPEGSQLGDDVADKLGIVHYEPPEPVSVGGEVAKAPSGMHPKYDVDAFLRWASKVFVENEPVYVTEKIHGANGRWLYQDEMHCGSRTEWKREFPIAPTMEELLARYDRTKAESILKNFRPKKNLWWVALHNCPEVEKFCRDNPGYAVYGEAYGIQSLKYGIKSHNECRIAVFDILTPANQWLDFPEFLELCRKYNMPHVPIIHESIPYNKDDLVKMAEGNSLLADHIREGVVVGPVKERWNEHIGRVKLKIINSAYK